MGKINKRKYGHTWSHKCQNYKNSTGKLGKYICKIRVREDVSS